MKTKTWTTKDNIVLQGYFREGKSDWNTHQSIIAEDEYYFEQLKGTIGVDIGGFIGSASMVMAAKDMQVFTVEALPENVEMIKKNLTLNNLSDKVKVYHRAIGATDIDLVRIYYGNTINNTGRVHEFIGAANGDKTSKYIDVTSLSLNTLFSENNLSHCDILKIDCEGGEWPAFETVNTDVLDKIHYIVGELHPGPDQRSMTEFMNLLYNKFDNISAQFGFKPQPDIALQGFMLKNKNW